MAEPRQLSEAARRIQAYLLWVSPVTIVFGVAVAAIASQHPARLAVALAGLMLVLGIMQALAYRMASQDRVGAAIWMQVAGLWLVAAALGAGGVPLYTIVMGIASLPVIISLPYVAPSSIEYSYRHVSRSDSMSSNTIRRRVVGWNCTIVSPLDDLCSSSRIMRSESKVPTYSQ